MIDSPDRPWWVVLGVNQCASRHEIDAAFSAAWPRVGDGSPELQDNNVPMTHETYMRLSAELAELEAARLEGLRYCNSAVREARNGVS